MSRSSIASLFSAPLIGVALLAGCDAGGSTATAPQGHDGKSATGHTGGSPAGGPNSPEAKADARRAAAAR
jgi:hypothetical protein